jgi:Family of unknown function (DUF5681)
MPKSGEQGEPSMTKKSSKPRKGYKVGKGRPPIDTRWKKGQSGNPKGRPTGSRGVSAVLHDVIRQKVPVTENGRTRQIPALEVMLRRLANDAMRSEPRALKLVLSLVERYADSTEVENRMEDVLAEDQEILSAYLPRHPQPVLDTSQDPSAETSGDDI